MSRQFNPPHPGDILREDVLPELKISVTEAARQLGVPVSSFPASSTATPPFLPIWLSGWPCGWAAARKAGCGCRPITIYGKPNIPASPCLP